jgi:hypothetical protein
MPKYALEERFKLIDLRIGKAFEVQRIFETRKPPWRFLLMA